MKIRYMLIGIVLVVLTSVSHAAWTGAHGDSDNRGFAQVNTKPATFPIRAISVGQIASGANPVTAPNGTVYIGNLAGELIAMHADGSPLWKRQLAPNHGGINASPVVGGDGSVYVVSHHEFTDHRNGQALFHSDVFLHRFTAAGVQLGSVSFPSFGYSTPRGAAPPNIWRNNGVEAIIVPAMYSGLSISTLRVMAYSTSLALLDSKEVSIVVSEVTGNSDPGLCLLLFPTCIGFTPNGLTIPMFDAGTPFNGVAIRPNPTGGAPQVVVAGLHDTVVYSFSPQTGLVEFARGTEKPSRWIQTPPVVLNHGLTAVGVNDFGAQPPYFNGAYLRLLQGSAFPPVIFTPTDSGTFAPMLTAAPTVLADGRVAVIRRDGRLIILNGSGVVWNETLSGASIASAAASCTHLFVSTENEFRTYDLSNMQVIGSIALQKGGRHSPVIGPAGHVYAMTEFGLNVFPAPPRPRFPPIFGSCGSVVISPPWVGVIHPIISPAIKTKVEIMR